MATFVWKNAYISINSVDLSDHIRSVKLNYGAEVKDATVMNDNGVKEKKSGFKDWSVEVTFAQDFAASSVDATLFDLVGGDAVAVSLRPTTDAVSTTNPNYNGNAIVETYPPIDGSVGDFAEVSITLQGTGVLTRSTS